MMLYPSIEEISKKADSRYTLVTLASKRARDIIDGKPILIDDQDMERPVSVASYEIAEDLITYKSKDPEEETETEEEEVAETEVESTEATDEEA